MANEIPHENIANARFLVDGHDVIAVHAPSDRLASITDAITGAVISIRMFCYMIEDDATGREVRDALVAACNRGVRVQLITDSFGSGYTPSEFFAPLITAGGRYHSFNAKRTFGYLIRNHQKILIADDHIAVIGGFNITDSYFGHSGEKSWEDFGVILRGDMVAELSVYYDALADLSRDGGIHYRKLRRLIRGWQPGSGKLQWLLGGPTNRMSPWAFRLKKDLESAQRFDLASAYFTPSQSILRRISKIAQHGSVRLVLAGKTDNGATIGAARSLYSYLLKRNNKIYEFQTFPLHMKLLVIDDACYIGSANLDARSLFINMEIMLRIENAQLADYLRALIDNMAAHSIEQTPALHNARTTFFKRIWWGLKYVLVSSVDYTIGRRIKFNLMRNR
jgi:cardiolipin synthase A/B